jgi:hypothetical protein
MTQQQEGKLLKQVEDIGIMILEQRGDIKGILSFQAKTEERLAGGVRHFDRIDNVLREQETMIRKKANSRVVYSAVGLGFTVLCVLITVLKLW